MISMTRKTSKLGYWLKY